MNLSECKRTVVSLNEQLADKDNELDENKEIEQLKSQLLDMKIDSIQLRFHPEIYRASKISISGRKQDTRLMMKRKHPRQNVLHYWKQKKKKRKLMKR